MKQIKVVHVTTYVNGGAGIAACRIHDALLSFGIDSNILSIDIAERNVQEASQIARKKPGLRRRALNRILRKMFGHSNIESAHKFLLQCRFEKQKKKSQHEFASLPFSQVALHKHPLIKQADIVHLHWVSGVLDYPSFFKHCEKPIVWTLHDLNPLLGLFHYSGDELRNRISLGEVDKAVKIVKEQALKNKVTSIKFVCPSVWLYNELKQSPFFVNCASVIIPNPVDLTVFRPHTKKEGLRELLKIPKEHTVILFVSQEIDNCRKGFDLLCSALNYIAHDRLTLMIIGHSTTNKFGNFNIVNLGFVKDEKELSRCFSLADVFILPSREDNLPNVMLESLACGTPVICFNVGGMREMIVDGVNGLKVNRMNETALAERITYFLEYKSSFDCQLIRQKAATDFNPAEIAQKYWHVYASLLNQSTENA